MKMLKPWLPWIALLGILAALLIPKWLLADDAGGGRRQASAPPVRTEKVTQSEMRETLRLNGTLISNDSVELRSEVPGRITEIAFQEGSRVQRGDILVRLNDADLQADLSRIDASLELAKLQEDRQKRLSLSGSGTQEAFDEARLSRAALEAERERLLARIEMTVVRAPFDGTIGLLLVSLGSRISTDDPIARLENLEDIRVEFGVPERHQFAIEIGTQIQFQVPGIEEVFTGIVQAVSPQLNPITRTLTCRAKLKLNNVSLRPGGFGTVLIDVASFDQTILIPATSVIPGLDSQTVYILEESKAVPRSVLTGLRTETKVQILEGISPGDILITSGIQSLRPGIEVNATDRSQPTSPTSNPSRKS